MVLGDLDAYHLCGCVTLHNCLVYCALQSIFKGLNDSHLQGRTVSLSWTMAVVYYKALL